MTISQSHSNLWSYSYMLYDVYAYLCVYVTEVHRVNWSCHDCTFGHRFSSSWLVVLLFIAKWKGIQVDNPDNFLRLRRRRLYVFGSSVHAAVSVRVSVRDSRGSFMFPRYLQCLLTDFCQTFVTGASRDRDELIRFWGQKVKV